MAESIEDQVRRLLEANRKARGATTGRFTQLADALYRATPQEFTEMVDSVLNEATEQLGGKPDDTADDKPVDNQSAGQPNHQSGDGTAGTTSTPNPIARAASPADYRTYPRE